MGRAPGLNRKFWPFLVLLLSDFSPTDPARSGHDLVIVDNLARY